MKPTISTKKTGAGRYKVTVHQDWELKGSFETNDMDLVDDIDEMKQKGFENQLINFKTFEEVEIYCLKQI